LRQWTFIFFVADDIDPQLPCPALQQLPLAIIIHTPLIPACSEFTDSHRAVTATNGKLKAPTVASVLSGLSESARRQLPGGPFHLFP
jgi:hypothetical protein